MSREQGPDAYYEGIELRLQAGYSATSVPYGDCQVLSVESPSKTCARASLGRSLDAPAVQRPSRRQSMRGILLAATVPPSHRRGGHHDYLGRPFAVITMIVDWSGRRRDPAPP